MTQGQIITFCIIARCCYARFAASVGALGSIGDESFSEKKIQLILVNSFMKTIKCYNPDATGNCLTVDDITVMINRVMEILGLCGDPLSLEESDTICCNPLNGVTIVN